MNNTRPRRRTKRKKYRINYKKLAYCLILPTVMTILIEIYGYNFGTEWSVAAALIWGFITWFGAFTFCCMGDID